MASKSHGDRIGESAAEGVLHRIAAHTVRRKCNQHQCTSADRVSGPCPDPHHRRDVHLMSEMLSMLGLDDEEPFTGEADLEAALKELSNTGPPPGVDVTELTTYVLRDR